MSRERIYFNGSANPTIGVEVELQILDTDTLELTSGASQILDHFQDDIHIKDELLDSIIEVNTGICSNVDEVYVDLQNRLKNVLQVSEKLGYKLVSIATHPFSRWKDQSVTKTDRYLHFLERMQWPLRRLLITGVHVHIGVESGEKAIAITNGLTRYIPHMIGLSANSPYFDGEKTGLASTRTKIFEGMPPAGLPPQLRNYSEFQKFMRSLQRANTIESIREVWWDIRPHPGYGTVEIRVFDSVPSLQEITDLAAFTQCLVVGLSHHYDDGTQLQLLDPWVIKENKWRATRFGIDADIIIDNDGNQQLLKDAITETIEILLPIAQELNCTKNLKRLESLAQNNLAPYKKQIVTYNKQNKFEDVLDLAVQDLKKGIYD